MFSFYVLHFTSPDFFSCVRPLLIYDSQYFSEENFSNVFVGMKCNLWLVFVATFYEWIVNWLIILTSDRRRRLKSNHSSHLMKESQSVHSKRFKYNFTTQKVIFVLFTHVLFLFPTPQALHFIYHSRVVVFSLNTLTKTISGMSRLITLLWALEFSVFFSLAYTLNLQILFSCQIWIPKSLSTSKKSSNRKG